MLILISSNAEKRFQRNILDTMCYPAKHILPFRYQRKYVRPDIAQDLTEQSSRDVLRRIGQSALVVYAQRPQDAIPDFEYCPIRFGRVVDLRMLGDVLFVDIELGDFPNLTRWKAPGDSAAFKKSITTRAGALNAKTKEGRFFDILEDEGWNMWPDESHEGDHWESVVTRIASLPSMNDCLFYRIRGFYQSCAATPFNGFIRHKLIASDDQDGAVVYPIAMGQPIELRMLFFRPAEATPKTISAVIGVKADSTGFSDVPVGTLQLESRYDELAVQLVTKRAFDSVLAPISISVQSANGQVFLTSSPLLLCRVTVPKSLLMPLLALLLFAPMLLAMTPSDWDCVSSGLSSTPSPTGISASTCTNVAKLALVGKGIGGLLAAFAGWIVFRKFPTGK